MEKREFDGRLLLVTTFLISICSIIYELMISSISTYLNGDSIRQFSITIGLYMSAMGIGSYLSKRVKKNLFEKFVLVEVFTGLLGGFSTFLLFYANIYTEIYSLIMYAIIIVIGILVGLEIPFLTRIIEENNSNIRVNLANIFTFDYIGGLVGSLAFPLFLFPKLGFVSTAFLVGCINLFAAVLIVLRYKAYITHIKIIRGVACSLFAILICFLFMGQYLTKHIEGGLYRDDIIYSEQTVYQKIVVTKHKDDLRLYLDGNIQFSSMDEYRYHELLVHVPFAYAKNHERVLILGGGDGLAAREILKYDDVKEIILVDLDPDMVELCKTDSQIRQLNQDSLLDKRITIIHEDAYLYVSENEQPFDVVIIDLPDPNNESLNKLYTNVFYNYVRANLKQEGVMVCQSTSPYYAKNSFWCIHKTIATQFDTVIPYHVEVPAFGDWGFNMAFKGKEPKRMPLSVVTSYLTEDNFNRHLYFGADEQVNLEKISVNDMFQPALIKYYNNDIENW